MVIWSNNYQGAEAINMDHCGTLTEGDLKYIVYSNEVLHLQVPADHCVY